MTLNHFLILSGILFSIGTVGVFLRRNLITILLSIEIMLNAHTEDDLLPRTLGPRAMMLGALLSVVLCVEVVVALNRLTIEPLSTDPGVAAKVSSVTAIGTALFTTYSFAFEVTSVLILVAMVGAVVLAKKEP